MGVQQRVYRPVEFDFPKDFPERLKLFKEASGLSWKTLAPLPPGDFSVTLVKGYNCTKPFNRLLRYGDFH